MTQLITRPHCITNDNILRLGQSRVPSAAADERVDVDGLEEHPGEARREEEVDGHGDAAAVRLVPALSSIE